MENLIISGPVPEVGFEKNFFCLTAGRQGGRQLQCVCVCTAVTHPHMVQGQKSYMFPEAPDVTSGFCFSSIVSWRLRQQREGGGHMLDTLQEAF